MILTALAGVAVGVVGLRIWQQTQGSDSVEGASPAVAGTAKPAPGRTKLLLAGAGVLLIAALGVLLLKPAGGDDGAGGGTGLAMNQTGEKLDDVDTMIERLAARLKDNPGDGEGFRMLGWSYLMTGRPEQAIGPFERAIELLPQSASAQSGYGEALVAVGDGKVTPQARAAFEKALALDPSEPRARYFRGRWLAQEGKQAEALDLWIDLANSAPADAPWQADIRRDIDKLAGEMGVDVSGRLQAAAPATASGRPPVLDSATVQAANSLPPAEQDAMIEKMVEGLATRLKANPQDPEGWARLIRSRMVRGQADQARADLATARKALADDPAGLALVNATAREVGVP